MCTQAVRLELRDTNTYSQVKASKDGVCMTFPALCCHGAKIQCDRVPMFRLYVCSTAFKKLVMPPCLRPILSKAVPCTTASLFHSAPRSSLFHRVYVPSFSKGFLVTPCLCSTVCMFSKEDPSSTVYESPFYIQPPTGFRAEICESA